MPYFSDIAVIKSKPYEPSGYVAGHLRFKFIREEAMDTKGDDDDDDDDDDDNDNDNDDDQDRDGHKSKEGGIKGSKAQKSREVVTKSFSTKSLSFEKYFILNKLSPIVDIILKESEWYDCLATAPEGGVSITAAWTSSDIRLEVQCT